MEREYFEHVVEIARIKLSEEEKERFFKQIQEIFSLLERVKEIDFPEEYEEPVENPLRKDVPEPFEKDPTIVFPKKRGRYLEVPRNL
ncbi:MAG: aspartyl/glutamyl-tRNA amidotransferase subunit C [Candidatus Diapherotrites archaeon]|nr:aspartyl/glutamyl-tRNA amidotransferase subunit C [Candidatus Diapherotrites archaeon]